MKHLLLIVAAALATVDAAHAGTCYDNGGKQCIVGGEAIATGDISITPAVASWSWRCPKGEIQVAVPIEVSGMPRGRDRIGLCVNPKWLHKP
jgi:hypothetical protein